MIASDYIYTAVKQMQILRFFARWISDWCEERRREDGADVDFVEQTSCFRCGKGKGGPDGVKLFKCARCGKIQYCSRKCQASELVAARRAAAARVDPD